MKFIQRIKSGLKSFVATPSRFIFGLTNNGSFLRKRSVESDPAGAYAGVAYAAISMRAKRVAAARYHLSQLNRDGSLEELDDHELLALLYKPNILQSQYQFFYLLEVSLCIWGSAPIYKDHGNNPNGPVLQLWPLRPDCLMANVAADRTIKTYTYRIDGVAQELRAEDVLMINEPSPTNILVGNSPLIAAGLEIDADMAAAIWNKCLLENWAEPGLVLTTEQKLNDTEFERLQKLWSARNSGPHNAGRAALLEKGIKPEKLGTSPKDMDLTETRKGNRNSITAVLGVPMSLLTSEDVNLANAEVGERVFARNTVDPQLNLIFSVLDAFFVPEYGDTLWLWPESQVPDDTQMKINLTTAGWGKFMTVNDCRDEFNMDPLDGGDSIFIPIGNIAQVGDGAASVDPMKAAPGADVFYRELKVRKGISAKDRSIIRSIKARSFYKRKVVDGLQEKVYAKIAAAVAAGGNKGGTIVVKIPNAKLISFGQKDAGELNLDPRLKAERIEFLKTLPVKEREFKIWMQAYFTEQEKTVIRNVDKEGLPKSLANKSIVARWVGKVMFDRKKEDVKLTEGTGGLYRDNILEGAAKIAKLLGIAVSDIIMTPFVAKFIEERSFTLLTINQTTRDALAKTLAEGVKNGENIGQIRERITAVYDDARGFRAETIARSETGPAQCFGRQAEMENQNVENKMWICSFSNSREEHQAAHGQVVKTGDSFTVWGESLDYPGDPSGSPENCINCQCSNSPTLQKPDDSGK